MRQSPRGAAIVGRPPTSCTVPGPPVRTSGGRWHAAPPRLHRRRRGAAGRRRLPRSRSVVPSAPACQLVGPACLPGPRQETKTQEGGLLGLPSADQVNRSKIPPVVHLHPAPTQLPPLPPRPSTRPEPYTLTFQERPSSPGCSKSDPPPLAAIPDPDHPRKRHAAMRPHARTHTRTQPASRTRPARASRCPGNLAPTARWGSRTSSPSSAATTSPSSGPRQVSCTTCGWRRQVRYRWRPLCHAAVLC